MVEENFTYMLQEILAELESSIEDISECGDSPFEAGKLEGIEEAKKIIMECIRNNGIILE